MASRRPLIDTDEEAEDIMPLAQLLHLGKKGRGKKPRSNKATPKTKSKHTHKRNKHPKNSSRGSASASANRGSTVRTMTSSQSATSPKKKTSAPSPTTPNRREPVPPPTEVIVLSDGEESDGEEEVRPPRRNSKKHVLVDGDDADADADDRGPESKNEVIVLSDSEEEEEESQGEKEVRPPRRKNKKRVLIDDDDDDDDDRDSESNNKVIVLSDSEEESDDAAIAPPPIVPPRRPVQTPPDTPPNASPATALHMLRLNLKNACFELAHTKIAKAEQERCRRLVHNAVLRELGGVEPKPDNFHRVLTGEHLQYMLQQYDALFFSGRLLKLCLDHSCIFVICWNKRCTATAGYMMSCKNDECHMIKIHLAVKVFQKAMKSANFKEGVKDGNLTCYNTLECLQLTFEHELVHAIIQCLCDCEGEREYEPGAPGSGTWTGKVAPESGHSRIFMSILNNVFGHESFTHTLNTDPRQQAADELRAERNKVALKEMLADARSRRESLTVNFLYNKKPCRGILKKVNRKNARVEITEPAGRTGEYDVPLEFFVLPEGR